MADDRPLTGYAALASLYVATLGTSLALASRFRSEAYDDPSSVDLATGAVAVFKLSRMVAKDDIAAFIRAPFVSVVKDGDEISEEPRGSGLRKATGELVTCPHCLGLWTGGAVAVGFVAAPRVTRILTSVLTASAIADFLHVAYSAAES